MLARSLVLVLASASVAAAERPRLYSDASLWVASGARHSCAITERSDAICWGANDAEQSDVPGIR